ncbi:hypothetical protein LXL04_036765 [Taraxacum kok-saghyz]
MVDGVNWGRWRSSSDEEVFTVVNVVLFLTFIMNVQVSAYLLESSAIFWRVQPSSGEFSHLLARRLGCTPNDIFFIINEKLPTVSTPTISILLSTCAKIVMHLQPPDPLLQNQIWAIFTKYETCIDAEIQQRAVEYFALTGKVQPCWSSLIKKAKNTKTNTAELGAIKLRAQQQQASNALVVTDQHPVNEPPQLTQLPMVKIPTTNNNSVEQELTTQANGTSRELINIIYSYINIVLMSLQSIGDIAERFNALCVKDSGVLYEDPYVHIGIKADWRAHQGRVIIFLGNKTTSSLASVQAVILPPSHLKLELSLVPEVIPPRAQVENKLRIPAVINKFFQPIPVSVDEFFPHWRLLAGPPLKLQEVVRGVREISIGEMANLLNSLRLIVCPGFDPNPSNLVATTTFCSETTRTMLCLVRIKTDPADTT